MNENNVCCRITCCHGDSNNNGKLRIYFHLLKIDNNKFGFDSVIVLINVIRF